MANRLKKGVEMFSIRKNKPGLVRRMEYISVAVLIISVFLLFTFSKVQKVKENYTGLWENDAKQDMRLDKLEGK